jgi:predicted peroxiredoxin
MPKEFTYPFFMGVDPGSAEKDKTLFFNAKTKNLIDICTMTEAEMKEVECGYCFICKEQLLKVVKNFGVKIWYCKPCNKMFMTETRNGV